MKRRELLAVAPLPLAALLAASLALGVGACRRPPESVVAEAEFGVFFGGQVQELKEIAKELDPARQRHGIRLRFRAPLAREVRVVWELSLPVPEKGGPRSAIVGEASARVGETRLDVPLAFRPSDPLGGWHAKVSADREVVIDRDFTVVAAPPPPKAPPKPPGLEPKDRSQSSAP
ncbi:MAG TPA: hypothetical protein VEQ59_24955 [Polyangiaceae bacterium]|nr:hypothetical protein [Polyangiaceae bacterium]